VGAAGGGVATFIGWLIYGFILPYVGTVVDTNVNLKGIWTSHLSLAATDYSYRMEVRKGFRHWKGVATITKSGANPYDDRFELSATRRGDYVVLTICGIDKSRGSLASGLLHLTDRGNSLTGAWIYRPFSGDEVKSESISFHRT